MINYTIRRGIITSYILVMMGLLGIWLTFETRSIIIACLAASLIAVGFNDVIHIGFQLIKPHKESK